MGQRAFISHACADDKFVHKLASDLKKLGAVVWVSDWGRESGNTWPDKLAKAIRENPLFVLVILAHTITGGSLSLTTYTSNINKLRQYFELAVTG